MSRTDDRPVETCRVADSFPRSFSDKHSAGTRHAGDTACHVDGAAEPVAGAADGLSGRNTNPKSGQVLLGGDCDQVKGGVQQRNRVGAHQHDSVADRLDEPHRIDRNVASKVREPAGDVKVHPPSPECEWPTKFPPLVQAFDPSAVVVMWSLWDAMPHRVNGQWLEVGTPAWSAELTAAADCAPPRVPEGTSM